MLEIKNFSYSYNGKDYAVKDLNLHVKKGEIFGFIGPNGAGKTTTLKAICGILDFTEGQICINGVDIQKEPVKCKQMIAYVPDNPSLYESMTGIKYLNFIADLYGIEKNERVLLIQEYSKRLQLENALSSPISTYSHGMKQKLAIISALVHSPLLVILDEPFVGLDPNSTHEVKNIMKEMCKKGCSIFFSTHVLEVAEKLCDKVAIINTKLIKVGTIADVKGDKSLEDTFLKLVKDE